MDKLENALRELENGDSYPFHMPGHKRRPVAGQLEKAYAWDITEIDGFDNLHHPEGIIREEQEFAAGLFGADESFFLVNGSSCGVLGAIAAIAGGNDNGNRNGSRSRILMGRNAHKSAYNALYLADVEADYLYPEQIPQVSFAGPVRAESVEKALEAFGSYAGIFLTSPTYEGVISDIRRICEIAHEKGIPVIVDEAHGAHLGIWGGDGYFPSDALAQGADVVIQSLHKTLPSMTQTAILHVQGELVDREKLKTHLSMFQSSSPSYILMESMISCLHYCEENKEKLAEEYKNHLEAFYREGESLSCIKIWNADRINRLLRQKAEILMDPGKIIIGTGESGLSGRQLYDILREKYHLQMEMAARDYVIAMTSVMDTGEGFDRLLYALKEIDAEAGQNSGERRTGQIPSGGQIMKTEEIESAAEESDSIGESEPIGKPETIYQIRKAFGMPGEAVAIEESEGRINREFVYLYPPGIPLIVPGEKIPKGLPAYLKRSAELGLSVQGLKDSGQQTICCIIEKEKGKDTIKK